MTYSFRTTQTANGFEWAILSVAYGEPCKVVKSGVTSTRAKAAGAAKRWVLFFRRGGTI